MIRTTITLTALAAFAGFHASAQAPVVDTAITAVVPDSAKGTIENIDREAGTFTLKAGERSIDVKFDKDTTYYLDGKESTADKVLKVGSEVTVTHADGKASRIDAASAK